MIELHLCGDLRRHARKKTVGGQLVARLRTHGTLSGVLRKASIDLTEAGVSDASFLLLLAHEDPRTF
jgi:hypothetical protein